MVTREVTTLIAVVGVELFAIATSPALVGIGKVDELLDLLCGHRVVEIVAGRENRWLINLRRLSKSSVDECWW